jgi:hypothetical protein
MLTIVSYVPRVENKVPHAVLGARQDEFTLLGPAVRPLAGVTDLGFLLPINPD